MDEVASLIREARKYLGEFGLAREWMTAGGVAAAIRTTSGRIYTGISIDVSCGIGFCAEHAAIAEMLKHRETRIEMVVAIREGGHIVPPCGRCREFMLQINDENERTAVVVGEDRVVPLKELLPFRWY
ncbi:CMP/dCMP deaminase zinc-binding protein [Spirochaeta thermophila DSM 6578]|uniref:CMP/dCMP deaminase zinc-binding protein n=1 Tax=Winmispira thermophila (strain ATCC 700085 / DSM 6578 / Z-1203) TaxID=869211 RepID=G0GB26_WINT7|nr:hypothetical protein [Spirochaeta thermophila]AEJ61050.1 CMP/dCMP deaminase zinc-binding protein [Spirochaeta thermophila DSM 6578]